MNKSLSDYNQYRQDLFKKINFHFKRNKKMLEIGCGDGLDSEVLRDVYGVEVLATDVYKHELIEEREVNFELADVTNLPFKDESFDYVYLLDVLHHIDEEEQSREEHDKAFKEIYRVLKPEGYAVIVEANRYNPLFYPHMVRMLGHDHFTHSYFSEIVNENFDNVSINCFETHFYPFGPMKMWRMYEWLMEHLAPRELLAYNVAIVEKKE